MFFSFVSSVVFLFFPFGKPKSKQHYETGSRLFLRTLSEARPTGRRSLCDEGERASAGELSPLNKKHHNLISVHGDDLKCYKSIWWMPWRIEAMKDVLRCDKRRLAAKKL